MIRIWFYFTDRYRIVFLLDQNSAYYYTDAIFFSGLEEALNNADVTFKRLLIMT